ncbi:MAG: T9SS type A sorting domain-containing protein [Bacteroidetes bacterium]|nr:T9SS type A sorting domain-containing protein [Bacteroidota bacterium]
MPFDTKETVIVIPSLELTGTTTIDVFAENLTDHHLYSLNFQWAVGQQEVKNDNVRLFPNPTTGTIYLYGAAHATVYIYNGLGNMVSSIENFTGNTLNLSSLSKGVYLMKIEKSDHSVLQKKITIL